MKSLYIILSISVLAVYGRDIRLSPRGEQKDIVFVLDMSNSIGEENFRKMLNRCKEIISGFTVGNSATLFGLDVFSTISKTIINIDEYTNKSDLLAAIDNVQYNGGLFRKTSKALDRLVGYSFTSMNGHRKNAEKIAIIMIAGKSHNKRETIAAAKKAKKSGIKMIAFGIGSNIDWEEIMAMGSSG